MKIVCWNLNNRASNQEAWDSVFELDAALVLLSEVNYVPDNLHGYQSTFETATGSNRARRNFSTGMLVLGKIEETIPIVSAVPWVNDAFSAYPGNFVARNVVINSKSYRIISCHMPSWYVPFHEFTDENVSDIIVPNYSKMSMSDLLRSALTCMQQNDAENWIVGGDFNTSEFIGRSERQHEANRATIRGMENLGMKEVVRWWNGKAVPSYRHNIGPVVHQLDHLYLSDNLCSNLAYAKIGDTERYFEYSDHLPVIAELRL